MEIFTDVLTAIPTVVLLVVYLGEKLQQWSMNKTFAAVLERAQNASLPATKPATPAATAAAKPSTSTSTASTSLSATQPAVIVDQALVDAVKQFEGFSPKAYGDYKQYSIGYGTKATSSTEVITEAEAEKRLQAELASAAQSVEQFAPNAPVGVKQALTDLTYNTGPIWEKQGLGTLIKAGSYDEAKSHVLQYNHAGGEVLEALTKRREAEVSWFDKPL